MGHDMRGGQNVLALARVRRYTTDPAFTSGALSCLKAQLKGLMFRLNLRLR